MTKLPLSNIANLQNESTVVTTLATNNAATTAAMEKTLSRDGTAPNQMNSDFDMNSHRVLNLVDAIDNKEPATFNQLKNSITAIGQGAVVNGSYLTLSNNVNLLSNRVLTPGTNIGFTDTGATGTLTVSVNDAELNALALTNSAVDTVPYYTGLGTASVTSLPAYGRNLISSVDATTARATLNSIIGTDVEAHDPTLTALAAFNTNGLITQTAPDTFTARTLTGTGNEITITNGNGGSGNPTVSLPTGLTFTGKTVTGGSFSSPSITTPTGIVKADVGLSNVDNTSDTTKNTNYNSLTATLTNKSISGGTNTLSAVPLTALATQAAYTFVGNNTSSAAAPTAVDIAALTTKATPAGTDYVMVSDQAASGAWKKATVSSVSSGAAGALQSANNLSDVASAATSRTNLAVPGLTTANTFTVTSASALLLGPNGATNPSFQIDTSTASAATGLLLKPAAAAGGFAISTLSSGSNENLTINGKGTGTVYVNTLNDSTGPAVFIGSRTSSGDNASLLLGRNFAPASGLLNAHGIRDETVATQAVTASGFSGYASYDAAITVNGSATTPMNHLRNFQARNTYNSTGTTNELSGLWVGLAISNGLAPSVYGVQITDAQKSGSGSITNQYAYRSDTLLAGSTTNYFLFQGGAGNQSVLPGTTLLGGGGGRLSPYSVEQVTIVSNSVGQYGLLLNDTNSGGGGTSVQFFKNGSSVGSIAYNGTTGVVYNTSSDERLKDFIGRYDPKEAIRVIRSDPVRDFTWKKNGERAIGWGAQTSYAVSHELATPGDDDASKREGDEGFEQWGVDKGARTPYLWAALTDALDRIDELEKRLAKAGL